MTAASSLPRQDNVPPELPSHCVQVGFLWLRVLATRGVLSPVVPVVGYGLSIWLMAGTLQQPVARAGFFTHDLEKDNFCFVTILAVDCKLFGLRPGEKFSFTDIRATSLFKQMLDLPC